MTEPFSNQTPSAIAFDPPFVVDEPGTHTLPFVFNTPHSGSVYPRPFLTASRLDALALRRSEDAHVDRLFAPVVDLGAPLMRAHFPRAYLDVNREPYELDPRMFEGRLPPFANTRSMRVAGGLGTVPRVVADGQEIYRGRLPVEEAIARIEGLYKPYHRTLRGLIQRTARQFGHAILIDCHSMPSSSLGREEAGRADIVLGDRFGTSCSPLLTGLVEHHLRACGFKVLRNKPYAGGFITEHYGEPGIGRHALQIEINRGLYMNEASLAVTGRFSDLVWQLRGMVVAVAAEITDLAPRRIAAE
ncbi:N-formylglutamate amidohydrolase [Methylobacterium sp. Leaf399]|uniref:N-formylglutamate amidohydrolase n=1 Tax=unclassified Methylobacterium TaxID=2615210 RepID=UPI0007020EE0|nr:MULTISPECIES: N-formylglutamate amidohydrolase [unclassified Methylobacterium]KQT14703.1 N-formylglutamate amidohydrolase [Methylobacterium sp. Leaf399]KQT90371.1 N-formylglutamate amidohydrolase [Methylobacterium sp. Leaf466]